MFKRNPRIRALFSLGLCILALFLILACDDASTADTSSTPTSNPTPTVATSPIPTRTPTPTPTPRPKLGLNEASIGGTVRAFTAKYGHPTHTQVQDTGIEVVAYAGTDTYQSLMIFAYTSTKIVYAVLVQANIAWDSATGLITCIGFTPGDAMMGDTQDLHDSQGNVVGLYEKGFSAKLGDSVDAIQFVDSQHNLVKPGTFGINYYYFNGDNTLITQCGLNLGYQPVNQA